MMVAGRQVQEEPACTPAPLNITGIPVVPFESYEQVLACIEQRIESARKSFCVAINPIKMYNAWHDPELLTLLRQADIGICDGVGVSIASRILHGRGMKRITGCDLFFRLLRLASEKGYGVFLLGASAPANAAAREALQRTYPDLRIAGWHDGYFQDSQTVVAEINASGADLVFVAMGSPKQEQWIGQHRQSINACFCMGVGGSFDIASGHLRRAPRIFRLTGTEFLFRFVLEPRKRLAHQKILLWFLLRVLGRRLSGARIP
jgi:N-acetylglucosaminyldiphosphoundecaprenol N-acetyl-beta-D-mannosaminyltransferase